MRLAVYLQLAVAACGHAPPPPPAAAERPVGSAADLAGSWVTSDAMDFGYALTIGKDGSYDLVIDRNRMGKCEQTGRLAGKARAWQLTYQRDDCEHATGAAAVTIESFTGDALTLAVGGDRRTYHRAPAQ
ncbi:MAG TPA: hypothetical protein VLX92_28460 [Kofleriaceae bacterium]|nr:hypothetical protein [Kofleriaceae bacterium]